MNKKAFTLIELLIVIGIIAILASAVIVAINPGQQFAAARDATRENHINSINNAILSYQIDHTGSFGNLELSHEAKEICAINAEDCEGLADISDIHPNYISSLPKDPQGGVSDNGTGYFISQTGSNVSISSYNSETRSVGLGFCPPTFTDTRDGQVYKTVQIGDQCWMAEYLAYLPEVHPYTDVSDSEARYYIADYEGTNVQEAKNYVYDDGEGNQYDYYQEFGVLYNWHAAVGSEVCPDGWRIPDYEGPDSDFGKLENYLADNSCDSERYDDWECEPAGDRLKAKDFCTVEEDYCGDSGFNIKLAGYVWESFDNFFDNVGDFEVLWSTSMDGDWPYSMELGNGEWYPGVRRYTGSGYDTGNSVRCIKE